jgi:hypothetical protein
VDNGDWGYPRGRKGVDIDELGCHASVKQIKPQWSGDFSPTDFLAAEKKGVATLPLI